MLQHGYGFKNAPIGARLDETKARNTAHCTPGTCELKQSAIAHVTSLFTGNAVVSAQTCVSVGHVIQLNEQTNAFSNRTQVLDCWMVYWIYVHIQESLNRRTRSLRIDVL